MMALQLEPAPDANGGTTNGYPHTCDLPWPVDPTLSEGHVCECGRQWAYLPAHWEPLYTLEELQEQQRGGTYQRGCL